MVKTINNACNLINRLLAWVDSLSLWWVGLAQLFVVLLPHLALGQGSVFTVHDQLDEYMMNYVLTARHLGADAIPEMMGGINASGLTPAAVLFLPLFGLLSPFQAFMVMYVVMFLSGFLGMYLLVRELTDSSILAVTTAGCFCMLPLYPVYGLSQMGIPLVFYAFLCLYHGKRKPLAYGLVLFYSLTSHLVYTGYVVLGFAAFAWAWTLVEITAQRKWHVAAEEEAKQGKRCADAEEMTARMKQRHSASDAWTQRKWLGKSASRKNGISGGFFLLLATYIVANHRLFAEILFGQADYVSHREEMVNSAMPFVKTVWSVFTSSAQHAFTYQEKLVWPIFLSLAVGAFFYRRFSDEARQKYRWAVGGFVLLFLIAVFYGICKSGPIVRWKNSMTGFLHYFQMERVYWLYPAGWYLEFSLAASVWWGRRPVIGKQLLLCCVIFAIILLPTADTILHNSYFYRNVNQYNNGSEITGYISWESYYAEDLMAQVEAAIGRDMKTYRIAHLGISPAPSLMHGFYTVDGYSNNYPLDYKHAFRRVIAAELDKSPETAVYFDKWGNRCYLFNSLTGTYWMLEKGSGVQYEGLDFDMDALKSLGCEYLLSGGEIVDAKRLGLAPMGYFETEDSYWGIWLYGLADAP